MKYFYFVLLVIFISCSPQKRLERIISKHPELTKKETIIIKDTFITKSIEIDTMFFNNTDTFTITKDNIIIKYSKIHDTVKITMNKPPDTIIKRVPITVEKVIYNNSKIRISNFIEIGLLILILLIVIFKFLK